MVHHLAARGAAGLPAVRTGRTSDALHDRTHRNGTQPDRQLAGTEMGTHVHDARHVRRSLLRVVPALLQHELRRGLLRLDADPARIRHSGRLVRVPTQAVELSGRKDVQRLSDRQRHSGDFPARNGRRHAVLRRAVHGRPGQLREHGRIQHHLAVGHSLVRTRRAGRPAHHSAGTGRSFRAYSACSTS